MRKETKGEREIGAVLGTIMALAFTPPDNSMMQDNTLTTRRRIQGGIQGYEGEIARICQELCHVWLCLLFCGMHDRKGNSLGVACVFPRPLELLTL